jgi:uncharacterized protein (DUF4213/DUF364 family)
LADTLMDQLLAQVEAAPVEQVLVGSHWTAVVAETGTGRRCGLATSLREDKKDHHHGAGPGVKEAGRLHTRDARTLAGLVHSESPPEISIGMAAINAMLPHEPEAWVELNAEEVIAQRGAGKHVALVGHFPFVPRLRERVGRLSVLELEPRGQDLPAEAAPEIIPHAEVVAITSLTLLNKTFEGLLQLCAPDALVLLLGPTTPMSPLLYQRGVHILSGSVVEEIDAVLAAIAQGGNFRQIHRAGVRLVTMTRNR